jgi:16S rRNA (guanine966-N2)-methyltransferase
VSLRISGGRRLRSPAGNVARPTSARVRLAVMNLLADRLRGAHWLDLCCGSGAMACEALQRGVARLVAIERDPQVAAVARANLQAVAAGLSGNPDGPPPCVQVHATDARRWLARDRGAERFDLIYLDPPWPAALHHPLSVAVAAGGWLRPGGLLVWELPSAGSASIPEGWVAREPRRYGTATILILQSGDQESATQEDGA